jgi:hypothetical protein
MSRWMRHSLACIPCLKLAAGHIPFGIFGCTGNFWLPSFLIEFMHCQKTLVYVDQALSLDSLDKNKRFINRLHKLYPGIQSFTFIRALLPGMQVILIWVSRTRTQNLWFFLKICITLGCKVPIIWEYQWGWMCRLWSWLPGFKFLCELKNSNSSLVKWRGE